MSLFLRAKNPSILLALAGLQSTASVLGKGLRNNTRVLADSKWNFSSQQSTFIDNLLLAAQLSYQII